MNIQEQIANYRSLLDQLEKFMAKHGDILSTTRVSLQLAGKPTLFIHAGLQPIEIAKHFGSKVKTDEDSWWIDAGSFDLCFFHAIPKEAKEITL